MSVTKVRANKTDKRYGIIKNRSYVVVETDSIIRNMIPIKLYGKRVWIPEKYLTNE